MSIPLSKLLLDNDIPGVNASVDLVDGDPLWGIIEPRPEVWISPSVPWQEPDVDVDDAIFMQTEIRLFNYLAISKTNDPVHFFVTIIDGISFCLQGRNQHLGVRRKQENFHNQRSHVPFRMIVNASPSLVVVLDTNSYCGLASHKAA